MNCPRCGEKMYGSVCPRCGNVVMTNRTTTQRTSGSTSRLSSNRNSGVKFMDNNGSNRAIKPKNSRKKSKISNGLILRAALLVLALLCVILFAMYRSASGKLAEAQATINTQNESIKAKDEEITQLKESAAAAEAAENSDDGDDSAPSVEFDENGNVVNITEGSDSDSTDDEDSEEKTEYKSGDVYTIKSGDTGSVICQRIYGEYTSELWEKLLSANGMTTSSQYHPGDELKIP